jgi:acyl-CoA thioester hydrolase
MKEDDASTMKPFTTEYRVIYGDCDPFDVVYYANYFDFFERGRTEFLRELGLTYRQISDNGIFSPVSETYCKYVRPARYDDLLVIETTIAFLKRASIRFEYKVYQKESKVLLARGYTVHAFVNREGRIKRAHKEIVERVKKVIE